MDHLVQSMEFKIDFTYNKLLAGLKMFQPRGQTYWEDDSVDVSLTRIFELITRIVLESDLHNLTFLRNFKKFWKILIWEFSFSLRKSQLRYFPTLCKDKIPYRYTWFRCNGPSNIRCSRMETASCVYWCSHGVVTFYKFLSTLGKFKIFQSILIPKVDGHFTFCSS